MRGLSCAVILTLSSAFAPAVQGREAPRDAFVPLGELTEAPRGFSSMCARSMELCQLGAAPAADPQVIQAKSRGCVVGGGPLIFATQSVSLVAQVMCDEISGKSPAQPVATALVDRREAIRLIRRVNSEVNRTTIQVEDIVSLGVEEHWNRLSSVRPVGDCEDMAIEKRVRLTQAGFPPERLFLATAYKKGFGLHTVLIARIDNGDVVLDSLEARVRQWAVVRYSWLRVQSPGDPMAWRRLQSSPAIRTELASAQPSAKDGG